MSAMLFSGRGGADVLFASEHCWFGQFRSRADRHGGDTDGDTRARADDTQKSRR